MDYIEVAPGSVRHRGIGTPLSQLASLQQKAVANDEELYRSYYTYNEDLLEYLQTRHTVRGYPGKYYCERIVFDIDNKDNNELCISNTRDVVMALNKDYGISRNNIRIAFSGRGFHVWIPNLLQIEPSNELPRILKVTLHHNLPKVMEHADNIFDGSRLIRVLNTINKKSGLYKIPINIDELLELTYDDIADMAKEVRNIKWNEYKDKASDMALWRTFKPPAKKEPKQAVVSDFSAANVVTCVQRMFLNPPVKGNRHNLVLRMASAWRRAGLPKSGVVAAIKTWWDDDDVERLVDNVFTKKYQYGCHDTEMKNYCSPACIYYTNKDYTIESMDIESLEDSLVKRVATDFTQTSFDLADIYDIKGKYTFYPGELVTFMGDTGLGKTAWIQNLCAHIKLNVLYLSLEMSDWLMYRRFCQIASGHDSATVKENMMAKYNGVDVNMPIEYKKLLTWDYNRSLNIMTTRPEVYNIKNIVATHKPHVLVIDHIGFLKSNIHDPRGKISHITGLLKDIAIQQDCIVIAVSHIRRPGENETLNLHMGKESSSIEQDSDKVIGIIGQQNETIRTIKSLKSRDEGYFSANFDVNFDNFRFMQI